MTRMLTRAILEPEPFRELTLGELLLASFPEGALAGPLSEASIRDLWKTTQRAFPKTKRRLNILDRVRAESVKWQPFPGMKIVLASARVRGEKHADRRPGQKVYRTHLMFRDVEFSESPRKGFFKVTSRGSSPTIPKGDVFFERLSFNDSVRVRCNCPDFRWRWNWECDEENPSALFGPKAPPYTPPDPENYRGPANPSGLSGICKHIGNLSLSLSKTGVLKV